MTLYHILFVLLMVGLIAGGLYMSRIATIKEEETQAIKARLRKLRSQQTQYEELFSTLLVYDRDPNLLHLIHQNLMEESEKLLAMDPANLDSQRDVAYYQALAEDIDNLGDQAHQPEIPTSDRQINLMKRHFGQAIKWIRALNAKGLISEADSLEHINRLRKNGLLLEIETYKQQGMHSRSQKDFATASSYFKHAKDLLINSDVQLKDKPEQIKKISQLISGLYDSSLGEDPAADTASQSASSSD